MAAPIQTVYREEKSQEELHREALSSLLEELAENKSSLEETLKLVQELHKSGLLEAVRALLEAKAQVTKVLLEQTTRPEAVAIVNNLMNVTGGLSQIDPSVTERMMQGVAAGLKDAGDTADEKKVGVFSLAKSLKDPDINRSLKFFLSFLRSFGKHI